MMFDDSIPIVIFLRLPPPAALTTFACKRLLICRPPGGYVTPSGRCRWRVASYRQLRSLRSLASGYGYVALRADDAACGGFVAPSGRCRWWVASYRQLRSLRSLASGYGYVALRADDAACGGFVAPSGRCRWWVASYRQLQIVVVDGKIPAITYIY